MMTLAVAVLIGLLFACAVYGILQRSLARIALGLLLLSHAANLLVFTSGGLTYARPAIIEEGKKALSAPHADPLPQALVLTAIVIGFGLITFVLALVMKAYRTVGSDDVKSFQSTEQ